MRQLVLPLLLLLSACQGQGDAAEAAKAVRAYDDALVRAYAGGDAKPLADLATAKELGRVQVLVDLKSAAKLVLESRIEAFEVTSSSASGDAATVETRERWRYHDRHLEPGKQDGPDFVADMKMRYELVREGGRWKVGTVSTLSNEYLEPKGGKPAVGHGKGPAHGEGAKPAPSP
ncbi:MAG: hypothetical protein RJA59_866 [Pseudomonadota bacterium]